MRKKYFVSFEKFKKLYFYKFVFTQIWEVFSIIEFLTITFFLPKQLAKLIFNSNIAYFLFIPIGVCAILWFFSLGWYIDKKYISKNSFIIIKNEYVVYQTLKQLMLFSSPHNMGYHYYIYTINNISNILIKKGNITIYGDITMERRRSSHPKDIIAEKHYTRIKIPNIFERQCIDDIQRLLKKNVD